MMHRRQQIMAALTALTAALSPFTAQALLGAENIGGIQVSQIRLIPAITTIVNVLLTLAAIIAVIFVIIGGVKYITSQGDEQQATEAKKTILYAVIGILVIGLSAAIINFVAGAIFGVA